MSGVGATVTKRQYTEDDKATALVLYEANGKNALRTARELEIPEPTLRKWVKGEGVTNGVVQKKDQKRVDLSAGLEEVARKLIRAMPEKIADATLQQIATSLGITIDKMQLLRGEPTASDTLKIEVVYVERDNNTR